VALFEPQARYLAERGYAAIRPDYRVRQRNPGATPHDSVKDARSALRYIKTHAGALGIDADAVFAGGGSAGGHLALCTACAGFNDETDDVSVDPTPAGIMAWNAVLDTSPAGWGGQSFAPDDLSASPVHLIRKGLPPTLLFHGTADDTTPYENAVRYTALTKAQGNDCELVTYEGRGHGFFNTMTSKGSMEDHLDSMGRCIGFLKRILSRP
jgi:acetyl esterase/lipase